MLSIATFVYGYSYKPSILGFKSGVHDARINGLVVLLRSLELLCLSIIFLVGDALKGQVAVWVD